MTTLGSHYPGGVKSTVFGVLEDLSLAETNNWVETGKLQFWSYTSSPHIPMKL